MAIGNGTMVSLPYPSTWRITASIGGRPTDLGTLIINNVTNNRVSGSINFRGTFIPIQGFWNENTKQITFDSPYATFVGNLAIADDPQIKMRHYVLRGTVMMKPPSTRAGEHGTWAATTDISLS